MFDLKAESAVLSESELAFWRWWNRGLIVLIVAVLVTARCLAYASGGGLWRDETHTVDLATHPHLAQNIMHDTYPILWTLTLRGWVDLFGSSDAVVRALGLICSLAIIPAIFWMARPFGIRNPYWMLLFLGLDPTLIVFGGEVRACGLGVLTLLILVGSAWRTLQSPSRWRWAGLCAATLLAVQASYPNCVMVLGTVSACCVVALRRREFRSIFALIAIGVVSAASMLPYAMWVVPRVAEWSIIFRKSYAWDALAAVCFEAIAWGGSLREWAWLAVGLIAAAELARQLIWRPLRRASATSAATPTNGEFDRALFAATFFVVASAGFWGYAKQVHVQTEIWYYLPFLTVLAITTELGAASWAERSPPRYRLKMLGVTACLLIAFTVVPAVRFRMTNIDLVAEQLSRDVKSNDLVVVSPWYLGISFQRYYHGSAPWTNFPDVNDFLHGGYQEIKQKVMSKGTPAAITPDLARIRKVLQSGGRIWWMGQFLAPGRAPIALGPAPDSRFGWDGEIYLSSCLEFAGHEIQSEANISRRIDVPAPPNVNPRESPTMLMFQKRQ